MKKSVGILGGMGPMATCDLFHKIISHTNASHDQEHIHIYIDNNTSIPDRTRAILYGGKSPINQLVKSAIKLQMMGSDFLIMPCNTAHYFYDEIIKYIDIPMLNMPDETAIEIRTRGYNKVGILATEGTLQSEIYQKSMGKEEIEYIIPSIDQQKFIMEVIYDGIKAGNYNIDLTNFNKVLGDLFDKGAETVILACTELPLAFEKFNINYPNIDATDVLARATVRFATENSLNLESQFA
ncbi:amino acid racemase [Tissierella sp. Yu-01]|uniref:aspartate/glutamate racemase family protein n=1 Tax=Tissierella sp. Yu-01 TaxID=3035694 RepID=UPI00240CEE2E|nr:amino acid racemase [Tissierella sp. Yu-01]WFA08344.1 amino acid racemase [Tissierella sp. Yu-01]